MRWLRGLFDFLRSTPFQPTVVYGGTDSEDQPMNEPIRPIPRLTRADYFKLHGQPQGPDREHLLANADEWLRRANCLLAEAARDDVFPDNDQVSGNPVASGFRPSGVNARTSNAAKASTHLTCEGGDLQDTLDGQRQLAVWCIRNLSALERIGLWMEDPRWTAGRTGTDPWVHLQIRPPGSGRRVYVPSTNPAQEPDFYLRYGLTPP